jgi:hypothetical protein
MVTLVAGMVALTAVILAKRPVGEDEFGSVYCFAAFCCSCSAVMA